MTRRWPRREALLSRLRDDRGDVLAGVVMLPIAFLAVLGGIHLAIMYNAQNVAAAAAQDALYAASQFGSQESDGREAAERTLGLWPSIENADIDVDQGNDTVTVTIEVQVKAPMPWLKELEVTATGPYERFYEEAERDGS